ncbi:DeoR/GlpR family DNA-binding transcription regulator [Luteococcus sp. H138]|uniref:DeoR/GlpR family DNA-binding transcription regulator n=1 Tax=unclassified Luteococcus TaxID=2639923 RepID=UPI00313AD6E4
MDPTIPYERRQKILQVLGESEVAFIDDLAQLLDTSSSTVRRDVNALVKSGEITALRGGGIKISDRPSELPTSTKAHINLDEKRRIARAAAQLVDNGDTIYLDSGTTTLQMIPFLRSMEIRIVTTNTQALVPAGEFCRNVVIVGGDYGADIGSVAGPITEQILSNMFFDKAFIGTSGVSRRAGASTFDVREAAKKRIAHENSTRSYVLADHTKLGRTTFYKALDLAETFVITDAEHELLTDAKGQIVAE